MPYKIYVDSRFRVKDPNSTDCDFQIELPHPVKVKGRCFCDVFMAPNVFFIVRAGENQRVYLEEEYPAGSKTFRQLNLTPGSYNGFTLATELQNNIDSFPNSSFPSGSWTVTYNDKTNKLEVRNSTVGGTFKIYPTESTDNWMSRRLVWIVRSRHYSYDIITSTRRVNNLC